MAPDRFQQAWQADTDQTSLTFNADQLLKVIQLDQRSFRSVVLSSDFISVGIALVLIPVWFFLGATITVPWTWYLMVPVLIWHIGFTMVFRLRTRKERIASGGPLLECVEESLNHVEDEIWLQRNYVWWNLLPFSIAMLTFAAHSSWIRSDGWWDFLDNGTIVFGMAAILGCVYAIQRFSAAKFEPRRQELLDLLDSLRDETQQDSGKAVVASVTRLVDSKQPVRCKSPVALALGACGTCLIVGLLVLATRSGWAGLPFWPMAPLAQTGPEVEYSKRSPFTGVRWNDDHPEVEVDNRWFKLVSLDGVPVAEIISFGRRTYRGLWQKRFEEDLVELLSRMGHPPGDTVQLELESLTTAETSVRSRVPMTAENRSKIYDAATKRSSSTEFDKRQLQDAIPIERSAQFTDRVNTFMNNAVTKAGFSGVVIVARDGDPLFQASYGQANLEFNIPNTLDTPFRVASLSKQFTAAAILHLESEGKLSTADPVHRYLPEFEAESHREITLYHLLTHTSGLPRTPDDPARGERWDAMSRQATPVVEYVALAAECPLLFEPGQERLYSNFGYRVLAAVIEKVADQEYADYMEQEVFQPLGLQHAGVARISEPKSERSVAQGLDLLTTQPTTYHVDRSGRNYGTSYGSGGIFISANDLLRWDRILTNNQFLSPKQTEKLFRPFKDDYACGWLVYRVGSDDRLVHSHSGANSGFFSRMMRFPDEDLVIIALGNVQPTDEIDEVVRQLFLLCSSRPYYDW